MAAHFQWRFVDKVKNTFHHPVKLVKWFSNPKIQRPEKNGEEIGTRSWARKLEKQTTSTHRMLVISGGVLLRGWKFVSSTLVRSFGFLFRCLSSNKTLHNIGKKRRETHTANGVTTGATWQGGPAGCVRTNFYDFSCAHPWKTEDAVE